MVEQEPINQQPGTNPEIVIIPENERRMTILSREVLLPGPLSQTKAYLDAMNCIDTEEVVLKRIESENPEQPKTEILQPTWRGSFGFLTVEIKGKSEQVFIAGSNIRMAERRQQYQGELPLAFFHSDLAYGPKPRGGNGWSLTAAYTDHQEFESRMGQQASEIERSIEQATKTGLAPIQRKELYRFLSEHEEIINKHISEAHFEEIKASGGLEIDGKTLPCYFLTHEQEIISADPVQGLVIKMNGVATVRATDKYATAYYEIPYVQTVVGWENAKLNPRHLTTEANLFIPERNVVCATIAYGGKSAEVEYPAVIGKLERYDGYPNTIQVFRTISATTPIGEVEVRQTIFDARSNLLSLPEFSEADIVKSAKDDFPGHLGLDPEYAIKVMAGEFIPNGEESIDDLFNKYQQLVERSGQAKNQYGGSRDQLLLLWLALNGKGKLKVIEHDWNMKFESNDGMGTRSETYYDYYLELVGDFGDLSFNNKRIEIPKKLIAQFLSDEVKVDWGFGQLEYFQRSGRAAKFLPDISTTDRFRLLKAIIGDLGQIAEPKTYANSNGWYETGLYVDQINESEYAIVSRIRELLIGVNFDSLATEEVDDRGEVIGDIRNWITHIKARIGNVEHDYKRDYESRKYELDQLGYWLDQLESNRYGENKYGYDAPTINVAEITPDKCTEGDYSELKRRLEGFNEWRDSTSVESVIKFDDPPHPENSILLGTISRTEEKTLARAPYQHIWLTVPNTAATKFTITKQKGDLVKVKDDGRPIKAECTVAIAYPILGQWHSWNLRLADGMEDLPDGNYQLVAKSGKIKGHRHDYYQIIEAYDDAITQEPEDNPVLVEVTLAQGLLSMVESVTDEPESEINLEEVKIGKDKHHANREAWAEVEQTLKEQNADAVLEISRSKDARSAEIATVIAITSLPWNRLTKYSQSNFPNIANATRRLENIQKDLERRGVTTSDEQHMQQRISRFTVIWQALAISKGLMTEWVGSDEKLQNEIFYKFVDTVAERTTKGKVELTKEQLVELFVEVASS